MPKVVDFAPIEEHITTVDFEEPKTPQPAVVEFEEDEED